MDCKLIVIKCKEVVADDGQFNLVVKHVGQSVLIFYSVWENNLLSLMILMVFYKWIARLF